MSTFQLVRNGFVLLMLVLACADYFWLEVPFLLYLALSLLFLLLIVAGSSIMSLNFFTTAYTRLDGQGKGIALTFDDGPSAEHTPAVLELLEKYGATASFFCIGQKIEQNELLLRKIVEKGHAVGNHSYSHSTVFSLFGKKKVEAEIEKTNELIRKATGMDCSLFRPPYGVLNPPIAQAAAACCMKVIGWNIRSYDTSTKDPQKVVARVLSKLRAGSVVLLHDDRAHTPEILEAILAHAQEKGYQYKQAHELIA